MEISSSPVCPFCNTETSKIIVANEFAFAFYDNHPVTPGHTLIVPKRHIVSFFDVSGDEQRALFELVTEMRLLLMNTTHPSLCDAAGNVCAPDGFNIGINDGTVAGQTVMHMHIHLIPRYAGDTSDPRGGVRWIMPEKAPYWKKKSAS
jgi:diadenosine tetraphosphate (Ap4A) HIT family hydrolase